jgi:hypothetical protein
MSIRLKRFGVAWPEVASRNIKGVEMSKVQVIRELWQFMKENKKYWLAPIVITLVLFGVLLVLAKSSAIAPFIYTLF